MSRRAKLLAVQRQHGGTRLVLPSTQCRLRVELSDELDHDDYEHSFRRMFGNERMDAVYGTMEGSVRFYGMTPTSMKLEGLDRHQRLIDSYKKLHAARAKSSSVLINLIYR